MGYQLVLQFQGDALADYDSMVALEEQLIERLEDLGELDGHDVGAGQVNIFILTRKPEHCFECARKILEGCNLLSHVTAAYRPANGEAYTILWPPSAQQLVVA